MPQLREISSPPLRRQQLSTTGSKWSRACALAALVALCAATFTSRAAFAAADDAGMLAFNNHCRECHSYMKGDNRLGPSLYGVVGRKAGTAPGYNNYSSGVKNSGIIWTPEMLDKWIKDPQAVVSGNNMAPPYPGVADEKERQKIIAFLESDTKLKQPKPPATTN